VNGSDEDNCIDSDSLGSGPTTTKTTTTPLPSSITTGTAQSGPNSTTSTALSLIILATIILPIILVMFFCGCFFYYRKKRSETSTGTRTYRPSWQSFTQNITRSQIFSVEYGIANPLYDRGTQGLHPVPGVANSLYDGPQGPHHLPQALANLPPDYSSHMESLAAPPPSYDEVMRMDNLYLNTHK
jgi:hypothetical protein